MAAPTEPGTSAPTRPDSVTSPAAAYLAQVSQLLWPAPASTRLTSRPVNLTASDRTADGRASRQLIVLPGANQPRLLLPTGRRASAAAIRRYGEPGSARTRLATRALALLLAGGLGPVLGDRLVVELPDEAPTIESYLSGLLGEPVQLSLHLGAPRANRKPVLQLLTSAGHTVGFAKLGVNPLTAELVSAERAALDRLAQLDLPSLRIPAVLASGQWNGLQVLVQRPLPVWHKRRPLSPGQLGTALAELAAATGSTVAPLAGSSYCQQLAARLAQAEPSKDQAALIALLDRLAGLGAAEPITFGCWHGDLTPWNLASTDDGLLVWDWERFSDDVPIGYDALHYWVQGQVSDPRTDPVRVAIECVDLAPTLLAQFPVRPAAARLTALGYLAELSVRYLVDQQAAAGARLGAPGRWLLPAIEQQLS